MIRQCFGRAFRLVRAAVVCAVGARLAPVPASWHLFPRTNTNSCTNTAEEKL